MASKEDLRRLDSSILAVLCKQVAENTAIDNDTAERAWKLNREWAMLMVQLTPQPSDYKLNDKLRDDERKLVVKMADFLATVL
jgi:hypothetical protein